MTNNIKVLAVDDQDINLQLLDALLKNAGFELILADDGGAALRMLEAHHDIDVILLDRMLYGKDAIETVKHLKQMPLYKSIPIIMITTSWSPQVEVDAIAAGAYACMPKPYDKKKIISAIRASLQLAALDQE